MSSDNTASAVTYTSISFDSDGPSWVHVSEPKHPEYHVPSDDDMQVEDQPYADDASPVAESPRHIADSDSIEEDSIDYPDELEDDDEIIHNFHYAPYITRGIISVSRLDGIYEIDLSNSNINDSSMYAVSNKRAKLNLDSILLWHCRLGHISKKHIEKLQHDGLLNLIEIQSFEKCVSCMSGKMARKSSSHQVERAKDLLGLIHTDVCGPFRTVSRQEASYFVTFTDDLSLWLCLLAET
nr:hypothetical protein [Tanacetum cinerariifolium]